jgi:hypothetical protein
MPILLKFNENYADEFDLEGFMAISDDEWNAYKEKIKVLIGKNSFQYSFGTNQSVEWNSAEDYLGSFDVTNISQNEYDVLLKLFPYRQFQNFDEKKKEFEIDRTIPAQGNCPLFDDDRLKDIVEEIENCKKRQKRYLEGLEDGTEGRMKKLRKSDSEIGSNVYGVYEAGYNRGKVYGKLE